MLTQTEREAHAETRKRERELEKLSESHVCAECGGGLIAPWDGQKMVLRCGRNKAHTGITKYDYVMQRLLNWREAAERRGESTEGIDKEIQKQWDSIHEMGNLIERRREG